MFRKNDHHLQENIFDSYAAMNTKTRQRLEQTWAPIYYRHVFLKIDETPFAVLYSRDNGRPNFPVNILLSLEFIKHLKDYTDEEIIEQFYFNYQVNYALGLRTLGELYLAPRTLYEFRERVYRYTIENRGKDDLIFGQFEKLTAHFLEIAKINAKEQRVDSTQIMPNIKRAGRLSLAYDVLAQAVAACPAEILPEHLKRVVEADYKKELLYRCRGSQTQSRLQQIIALCTELLAITASHPSVHTLGAVSLAERFLQEQATFDSATGTWVVKQNKEIAANSLQSAYDPDATYRKKGSKEHTGYVVNIAETCADENPVQLITDYTLRENSAGDAQMLKDRIVAIKERTGVTDIYADGAYYSEEVEQQAKESGITIHYTNLTGSKPAPGEMPLTMFTIKDHKIIVSCPQNQHPLSSDYHKKNHILTAHFDLDTCQRCPQKDNCPVKFKKKSAVLRVSRKAVFAAEARERMTVKSERKESKSLRAAIEGTNSALKRSQGADKLRVRTKVKSSLVVGMKMIGRNIRQIIRFFKGDVRRKAALFFAGANQGVTVPI
ncbi:MAG: transposase [Firmicutes bacterium]|nr:transposase [Bacillota bacterium]